MKARLEISSTYTLVVGDRKVTGLVQTGEWEGFRKLVDGRGHTAIITSDGSSFAQAFGGIFSEIFDGKQMGADVEIVKASPSIQAALLAKEPA